MSVLIFKSGKMDKFSLPPTSSWVVHVHPEAISLAPTTNICVSKLRKGELLRVAWGVAGNSIYDTGVVSSYRRHHSGGQQAAGSEPFCVGSSKEQKWHDRPQLSTHSLFVPTRVSRAPYTLVNTYFIARPIKSIRVGIEHNCL